MLNLFGFLFVVSHSFSAFSTQPLRVQVEGNSDSTKVISSLYEGLKFHIGTEFSNFSFSLDYDEDYRRVLVCSDKEIRGVKVEFFMAFKFKGIVFKEDAINLSDFDEFEFLDSYFKINDQTIVSHGYFKNLPNSPIGPSLLWYGDEFGISGRLIQLKDRSIILLRGLDLYCNGHHCTPFQLYALELKNGNIRLEVFSCHSLYPHGFENIFLIDQDLSGNLAIFLPKDDVVRSKSDFEKFFLFD